MSLSKFYSPRACLILPSTKIMLDSFLNSINQMNFSLGRCFVLNITKRWQFSILLRQNIHKSKFILLLGQSLKEILLLFLVTHNQTVWTLISLIQSSPPLFSSSCFGAPVNRDLFGFTISRALGFSLNEQHALVRKGGNDAILVNALQYQNKIEHTRERERKAK